MVVGINTYFFQIVVFAAYPKAFLSIGYPRVLGLFIAQKVILKLVHARVSKQQSGIVFIYNWGRGYNLMFLFVKKR